MLALVAAGLLAALFLSADPAPARQPEDIASRFDVAVVWFEGDDSPCDAGSGGCFDPETPDVVYIMRGLDAEVERSLILHEIGHVLQFRLGLPLDECAADLFAESMGASWLGYAGECPT